MKQKFPILFLYILLAILILNLLQANFTQLLFDEAYYWYYAKDLAWGYFDHPPMVAWLIALGSVFFEDELGIRFLSCILSTGTMGIIWILVDHPKKKDFIPHFFVLILSMTLVHAYGFLMLPDTPLLFFTALFFLAYRYFLKHPGFLAPLFLGFVMAALMYSKYHAFLVIFFVLLSNLRLLRNPYAWMAVAVSLLCYGPHFYWLYQHEFVSVNYHLFERPNRPYEFFDFTLGYIVNLIAIFGLTFYWIYQALFRNNEKGLFTRALRFVVFGVLIFFLVSSLQRRVQTQWIIVICVPAAILVYNYMLNHVQVRKWIFRMGLINILILFVLRVGLIYEPLFPVVYETHGNKTWTGKITSQVGDIPVVFENSYRMAPMFSFYSGNTSYSLNNVWYRENQYSIDKTEESVRGRRVLYVSKYLPDGDIYFIMPDSTLFYGVYKDPFISYRKLKTEIINFTGKDTDIPVIFDLYNPYPFEVPNDELEFGLALLDSYKQLIEVIPIKAEASGEFNPVIAAEAHRKFQFLMPDIPLEEVAYIKVVISENDLRWGLNGNKTAVE